MLAHSGVTNCIFINVDAIVTCR